jgi:hypothetical protein
MNTWKPRGDARGYTPDNDDVGQNSSELGLIAAAPEILFPWRQPSFGHGAFDDVPLNPLTLRTGKRSQVLPHGVRLNRRQLHRRTASRASRPLVLFVEHELSRSVDARDGATPSLQSIIPRREPKRWSIPLTLALST